MNNQTDIVLAVSLLRRGSPSHAEFLLRRLLENDPTNVAAFRALFLAMKITRGNQGWSRECELFLADLPGYSKLPTHVLLFVDGLRHQLNDRYEEATASFRRSLSAGLEHPLVHHDLGRCLEQLGDLVGAEQRFQQAVALDRAFAPALDCLSSLLAERDAWDCIKRLATNGDSRASNEDGYIDGGAAAFNRFLNRSRTADALASAIERLRDNDPISGLRALWPSFINDPSNLSVVRTVVYFVDIMDLRERAWPVIARAIGERRPTFEYASGLRAWYEGNVQEALSAYDKALAGSRNHALIAFARALALEAHGDHANALESLNTAYTLQPKLACVRAALAHKAFEASDYERVVCYGFRDLPSMDYGRRYEANGTQCVSELAGYVLRARAHIAELDEVRRESALTENLDSIAILNTGRAMAAAATAMFDVAEAKIQMIMNDAPLIVNDFTDYEWGLVTKVASASPMHWGAAFALALRGAGDDDSHTRLAVLKEFCDRHPDCGTAWLQLGICAAQVGDAALACSSLERADRIEACPSSLAFWLSRLCVSSRDMNGLLALANRFPECADPLEGILRIALEQDDKDIVRDAARRLLPLADPGGCRIGSLIAIIGDEHLCVNDVEVASRRVPFIDCISKHRVARGAATLGLTSRARDLLCELIDDRCDMPDTLLLYGCATLCDQS